MKLRKWIESQGGARKVAQILGTESPTIYAWLRGDSTPKVLVMQKIVKLANGALTYDDIINETKNPRAGAR